MLQDLLGSHRLQSYILSTTTETPRNLPIFNLLIKLQSYILSTTTETIYNEWFRDENLSFNRTSFQQQLKRFGAFFFVCLGVASIVHPFNNN